MIDTNKVFSQDYKLDSSLETKQNTQNPTEEPLINSNRYQEAKPRRIIICAKVTND